MQEAYRPRRIKYIHLLSCPGGGYSTSGTPHPDLAGGGTPSLPGGTPPQVPPPNPHLAGGIPLGIPRLGGTPPCLNLAGVPPPPIPPSGPEGDTPPPCGQTDRHVSKHNLPVILRTWSVMILIAKLRNVIFPKMKASGRCEEFTIVGNFVPNYEYQSTCK